MSSLYTRKFLSETTYTAQSGLGYWYIRPNLSLWFIVWSFSRCRLGLMIRFLLTVSLFMPKWKNVSSGRSVRSRLSADASRLVLVLNHVSDMLRCCRCTYEQCYCRQSVLTVVQAFFRRSLRHKTDYKCVNGNAECVIERGSRNICSACRLRKCLHVGMSTAGW